MLDEKQNYIIDNYHKKSLFSSFLPGISGEHGIPLWCYYVNRGQAISCFGIQDKDHAMMEFYPAHQAYERTPLLGFRTFMKVNGVYEEAFADQKKDKRMHIGMISLMLEERANDYRIEVEYETLPQEPAAGLMREVRITNITGVEMKLEVADGMAEVLPFGVSGSSMKEMGQTNKAWMQTLDVERNVPRFKVRASMEDSAQVRKVEGANYGFARDDLGNLLSVIVDKEILFQHDTAFLRAWGFEETDVEELKKKEQITCNDVPCCFFLVKRVLKPMETLVIRELYGTAENQELIDTLVAVGEKAGWFKSKQDMAKKLTSQITERIAVKTGNPVFDAYCRQDYLDNLLRGGYPIRISPKKTFYLYSRKHGDMERDYNYFSMLPEMYSQGNGNFRDVSQNRRCDIYFSPFVGDGSIKTFYNALQINGYNPLSIEKVTYSLRKNDITNLSKEEKKLSNEQKEQLGDFLSNEFTPGELDMFLRDILTDENTIQTVFERTLDLSYSEDNTVYGEGYWCDHWTYNQDLIEAYLSVYPECERQLLFEDRTYHFRQADKELLPRYQRYVETEKGIRQYHYLKDNVDTSDPKNRYLKSEDGTVFMTNLISKMWALVIVKMAALDPFGMGIEMEGGKPGWYDALNGLPGLLGSSMAETYELKRVVDFLCKVTQKFDQTVELPQELAHLGDMVYTAGEKYQIELEHDGQAVNFWNMINDEKEHFWEVTSHTVTGKTIIWDADELKKRIEKYASILKLGIAKAKRLGREVSPTYFYYQVTKWEKMPGSIIPLEFEVNNTPDFLEGSVHLLKITSSHQDRKKIYDLVRNSRLYDKQLQMYKVNASLSEASFELGRACAFTPGWLENESIWLHMEYKYLLEILKSGLYSEFLEDSHHALVPFMDEEQYGRSLLENSSFLASSANPNPRYHGKGFVARLSGSTAEFLEIWRIMMFGRQPFEVVGDELILKFAPCIPDYLIDEARRIEATFMGTIPVEYELESKENYIPGEYQVMSIEVISDGSAYSFSDNIRGEMANKIRDGKAERIRVALQKKTPF